MSEEHDVNCPVKDDKQTDENEGPVAEDAADGPTTEVPEVPGVPEVPEVSEPSANTSHTSKEDSAIDKETLSNEVDEKKDLYGANDKGNLSWTVEGNEFRVSWSFPDGVVTEKDYIALCYTGPSCRHARREADAPVKITTVRDDRGASKATTFNKNVGTNL
ncbi:unnamed protein product [Chrysodeixis includens]|uniref:Uncharacterized protein n=1 Tax=Chrysodeixis includens TaxID=689277 RepID=A0A9N8Q035_CHRIL|nr:unnamed protein product [Chrysodeixis includens]